MVLLQASAVLQHQGLRNARRVVSDPLGQLLCEVGQPRLQRLQARNQGLEGLEGQKLFPLQIGHDLLRVDALCQAPDGSALRLPEVPLQLPEGHPHELPASRLGFEARGRANALTELAAQTAQLPQGDGLHEAAHACGRHQRLAVRLVASRSKLGTDLVVSNAGRHGEACLCSNLLPDPLHENEGGEQQCIAGRIRSASRRAHCASCHGLQALGTSAIFRLQTLPSLDRQIQVCLVDGGHLAAGRVPCEDREDLLRGLTVPPEAGLLRAPVRLALPAAATTADASVGAGAGGGTAAGALRCAEGLHVHQMDAWTCLTCLCGAHPPPHSGSPCSIVDSDQTVPLLHRQGKRLLRRPWRGAQT
mmetsp:Transcript_65536/g.213390  ORF Transcript_65536/g.213390 Transcript_65536/m.213390 type:complete len:361 (-) Transcript_65536:125-1207(-)